MNQLSQAEPAVDSTLSQLQAEDARLARLPAKPQRSAQQQAEAEAVQQRARALRRAFLSTHAEWIYDELSAHGSRCLDVDALAREAAAAFPGLLPGVDQLARERGLVQSDKDGLEIDQGIFFAAILSSPRCGRHLLDSMRQPGPRAYALLAQFQRDGVLRLEKVALERRGATAHLTFHNEACLNAEDDGLIADFETALDLALLDDTVQVGVLRGCVMTHPKYAGRRVFSAGINLRQLHQGRISYVGFLLQRELGYIAKILRGLRVTQPDGCVRVLEKPWLAAVDSFAIGGGAQILLACDHVIGASDSFFSLPAAQEGIIPGVANLRLTRHTGARIARQIILGGRRIRADEPDGALLFDRVVAPEDVDAAIEASAAELQAPAVLANRRMLALAEEPPDTLRAYLAQFAMEQALRLYAPDVLAKVARA